MSLRARGQIPFAPWRDHRHIGLERIVGQLEPDLIVALAGGAMRHGVGTDLLRNLDLLLGDQRPRDRRAEQILAFVQRIRAEHREHVVAHEFFAQILDKNIFFFDAEQQRLLPRRLELLALTEIGSKSHHLASIGGLQPLQDDRGIEPARIGEHDFLYVSFGLPSDIGDCRLEKLRRTIGPKVNGAKCVLVTRRLRLSRFRFSASAEQPDDEIVVRQGRHARAPARPLIRQTRPRPAIDQGVGKPNDQKREHPGKNDIGREMRAGHHADRCHAGPERERRAIGDGAPLRWRQGRRRDRPERAGHIAGDKSAIAGTIAARIPPGDEAVRCRQTASRRSAAGGPNDP